MPGKRYYLDTMILIHFDNNNLLNALRKFTEMTHSRLLTSATVLDETKSSKHKMSDSFSNILSDDIIEVVDDVSLSADRAVAEIETRIVGLGPGESSLIKLIIRDTNVYRKPVLVLNDGEAFTKSSEVGINAMLAADYLALLAREEIVACDDALIALESMLAKNLSRRRYSV